MSRTINIFNIKGYRKVIEKYLDGPAGRRPRGAVKDLAESLKCHSTFIAHVLNGKADFSTEQALRFAAHFSLEGDETDYLMDLVLMDKAGDLQTKKYFEKKVNGRRDDHVNFKKRLKVEEKLTYEQEALYFKCWLTQAIHILCQIEGVHTIESIAHTLGVRSDAVQHSINALTDLGFIKEGGRGYRSTKNLFHLGDDSDLISKSHYNWRLKTTEEMMHSHSQLPGTHYSSVVSTSESVAQEIRELILEHIAETREKIIPSTSEKLYVYCLDFYPLTRSSGGRDSE